MIPTGVEFFCARASYVNRIWDTTPFFPEKKAACQKFRILGFENDFWSDSKKNVGIWGFQPSDSFKGFFIFYFHWENSVLHKKITFCEHFQLSNELEIEMYSQLVGSLQICII